MALKYIVGSSAKKTGMLTERRRTDYQLEYRSMTERRLTPLDQLITHAERLLRHGLTATSSVAVRPAPESEPTDLPEREALESARLMRVNHAGEIAAQALYHGQAAVTRNLEVRQALEQAAAEEQDHLAWCEQRLAELGSEPSLLQPVWYLGSFAIGAFAGLLGDRVSLGFIAETERQVVDHLTGHLQRLPDDDKRSRAILEQMREDEARHGTHAIEQGGIPLPGPVRKLMRAASRVMTRTAYWI